MINRDEIAEWFKKLQAEICIEIENIDTEKKFVSDEWKRKEGGGGDTRIISKGKVIEKGGVNFSSVYGPAPEFLKKQYSQTGSAPAEFFATGVSIVMHPLNPFVPVIHMNVRYIEAGNRSWFGGGIDLTPHYVNEQDAILFHSGLKKMCDKFDTSYYNQFKKAADDYFFLNHRNETRGIGGIFFDHLDGNEKISMDERYAFVQATGKSFIPLYSELILRNKESNFGEKNIFWQRLRRGRYVEFNLLYDRGTKFGLDTDGRTESILMSLPPMAIWEYDYKPEKDSPEELSASYFKKGIDWIAK